MLFELADICNSPLSLKLLNNSPLIAHFFLEILEVQDGLVSFEEDFSKYKALCPNHCRLSIGPHTPFTVSFPLLKKISDFIEEHQMLTSMHLCESQAEVDWVKFGKGPFAQLLQNSALSSNACFGMNHSPVEYLQNVAALHGHMICAHGVKLTVEDIRKLKKHQCSVALCPRSNAYTGAGKAPVETFLREGLHICLGTDSLASNDDLNLFNEMRFLKQCFPSLDYRTILSLATLKGAEALRWSDAYGSLEIGKQLPIIAIHTQNTLVKSPEAFLVEETQEEMIQMITS